MVYDSENSINLRGRHRCLLSVVAHDITTCAPHDCYVLFEDETFPGVVVGVFCTLIPLQTLRKLQCP